MSVATRKKSWEEHVTQWMGLSTNHSSYDKICCHGITTDNIKPAMEEHEVSEEEKPSSFSECCYFGDCKGFLGTQEQISKDVDENDNLDMEDHYISPDTSIETVVNVPVGGEDHISKEHDKISCPEEAILVNKRLPQEETSEECKETEICEADNMAVYTEDKKKQVTEGEHVDSIKENNADKMNVLGFISVMNAPEETLCKATDMKEIGLPGEQLLHSAVIAQQRRKSEASKDGHGKNICDVVLDNSSCEPCTYICSQPTSVKDPKVCSSVSHLFPDTVIKENGVHNNGFGDNVSDTEKASFENTNKKDVDQFLKTKDNMHTYGSIYDQVRLRRKKVRRLYGKSNQRNIIVFNKTYI
ncbi:rho GTPase-activating protein 7-like [Discoglossus pictus]